MSAISTQQLAIPACKFRWSCERVEHQVAQRLPNIAEYLGKWIVVCIERVLCQCVMADVKRSFPASRGIQLKTAGRTGWGDRLQENVVIQNQGAEAYAEQQAHITSSAVGGHP